MKINIGKLVTQSFQLLASSMDGAVREVTYQAASGKQDYDPVADTLTSSTTAYQKVAAIFVEFSRKEKDTDFQRSTKAAIEIGDLQCLIDYSRLPIKVGMEDLIFDGSSKWRIVDYSIDPTGKALHTFHLRQA